MRLGLSRGKICRCRPKLCGHIMANFSVEWLSRSCYEGATLNLEARKEFVGFTKGPNSPNSSDGSLSDAEMGEEGDGVSQHQRRMRTKFTSEQIRKLESTFSKHRYLGALQRRKIAERLSLSETQVKTWFQNRRMKLKREVQDLRSEFKWLPATALLQPALFQHHYPGGQLPAVSGGFCQPIPPLHCAAPPGPRHPVILPAYLH
ncbi:ventral expressed homeobox [Nelusetta ayraudi]|uniref:ventral expressed homeobox n=1 Tax=Nelusetta ayraudi TaxID=303726 RepID=UPI003F71FC54